MGDLSDVAAKVPVYSNLFGLCDHGFTSTWTDPGNLARDPENIAMSSVGWIRI